MSLLSSRMIAGALLLVACGALGCERIVGITETKVETTDAAMEPEPGEDAKVEPKKDDARTPGTDAGVERIGKSDGAAVGDGPRRVDGDDAEEAPNDGDAAASSNDAIRPDASRDLSPPDAPPPACPSPNNSAQLDTFVPSSTVNCSFHKDTFPPYVAAVDSVLYASASNCGACMELSSTLGKVVVQVIEHAPGQPSGGNDKISVNRAAMDMVAPGKSTATALWRWVPCPVTGPITAALTSESSEYGWELILQNHTNRVAKVEYHAGDSNWMTVKREDYNYFHRDPAAGLPQQLRVTDAFGNVVVSGPLRWPTKTLTTPISLDVQFAPSCTY